MADCIAQRQSLYSWSQFNSRIGIGIAYKKKGIGIDKFGIGICYNKKN